MTSLKLICIILLSSLQSFGQSKKQRVVVDNDRKFFYSDSSGVTDSYIEYFGNTFSIPDLTTIDSISITQAYLKNKTIVFNFWFVSCAPCVAEIPALNRLAKKYQTDTTLFIAITFDKEDRIREFLQKRRFDFQIASLPQQEIGKIKKIAFYPFTAIITRDGKLSYALFGRPTGKNPEEEIFNMLDKQIQKALSQ